MHDEWDHGIKPTFDGRERTWTLTMPFECINLNSMKAKGFSVPKVKLTADDIRGVFDPTVQKIQALVDEQVRAVKFKTKANPKVRRSITIEQSNNPPMPLDLLTLKLFYST